MPDFSDQLFEKGLTVTAGPAKEAEKPPKTIEPALLPEWVRRTLLAHQKAVEGRKGGEEAEQAFRDAYGVFQMVRREFAATNDRLKPEPIEVELTGNWFADLFFPKKMAVTAETASTGHLLAPFLREGYITKATAKHSFYIDQAKALIREIDDTAPGPERDRLVQQIQDPLAVARLFYFVLDFAMEVHRKLPGA